MGFSLAGWLYVVLAGPTVAVPFGQRHVPSPLIWPAAAAVSTMLVSRSQLASWERHSTRALWPYRLAVVLACLLANLAVITLVPSYSLLPLVTWFAVLQGVALACVIVCGDRAWLPLAAIILVAMFELAQDGSLLVRALTGSGRGCLTVASVAVLVLAGVAAADGGQRSGPATD